jgi:hypothetical protein
VVEGGGASWGGRGRRRGAAGLRVFIVGRQAASLAPPPSSVPSSQVSSLVVLGASSVSSNRCATVCSSDEPMTTGSDGLGFGDYPSCTPGFFKYFFCFGFRKINGRTENFEKYSPGRRGIRRQESTSGGTAARLDPAVQRHGGRPLRPCHVAVGPFLSFIFLFFNTFNLLKKQADKCKHNHEGIS